MVGRPDELRGEAVVLYVVASDSAAKPTEAQLCEQLAASFEDWQIPKRRDVHLVAELPKTSVGKVDKKVLRKQLQTS